ncbi:PAS domain-containing sensor histidine kinase [Danxiaibacter flavus]|uniref:histidine kinase n=1 Tax=Danxiaibacter flavus TaxID=3049108 RepID=A0ABV3ZLN9_9BACT|nr:PAS domain-containing sensor histidine kinase [Chitinophagaceae bacterium DXS]
MYSEKNVNNEVSRFEALLEHASVGIVEMNEKGEITEVNAFALRMFACNKEDVINKRIEVLIPSRFHHKHVHHRQEYLEHPHNRPMGIGMDLFGVKKDGTEFPVEVSLSSYIHSGHRYVIAFINDITVRKHAEEEIKKLNDGLEQAVVQRTTELTEAIQQLELSKEELSKLLEREKELNELKSRFVSMASHEFRTPLSTILSSAYLLNKVKIIEDESRREAHLNRIISSVKMLTDILNDFLSVGKIEEGKIYVRITEFNLPVFVADALDELKNNLKNGQEIIYNHTGEDLAELDSVLVKHIIMNLVSNASKFSPEDAPIEIVTHNGSNTISLSVKDHGIGIPAEDQKHLMERFFRGSNVSNIQGTGLGLHIVARYSELMNGSISCISEVNEGTEIVITFNKI